MGASAGALNSAYFAAEPTPVAVARLKEIWCAITRADVFPFGWHSLWGLVRRRDFLVPSDGLRRLLETHLALQQHADLGRAHARRHADHRPADRIRLRAEDGARHGDRQGAAASHCDRGCNPSPARYDNHTTSDGERHWALIQEYDGAYGRK